MGRIHRVRQADQVGRIPIAELCEALSGAGTRAFAAADGPPGDVAAALRRLTDRWSSVGPDGPEATDDLPEGSRLTLMMYEAASHRLTVNYLAPDDGRPRAAKTTSPDRLLMSRTGDELTIADGGTPPAG
jgi:hypothetical protein